MKKNRTKRILSMLLTLCMVISLFPTVVSASSTGVTSVYLGGQKLDSNNPYLIYGWKSSTGTLGIEGCTAYFDSASGTLTLQEYDGGEINADGSGKSDLTVKLIGNNTITNKTGNSQAWGINLKSPFGALTITAEVIATLEINVTSDSKEAIGIVVDYIKKSGLGSATIGGNAKVKVKATGNSEYGGRNNYGIYCDGNITIKDNASFETYILSNGGPSRGSTTGIMTATGDVTINTSGIVILDGSKNNRWRWMIDCHTGTLYVDKIGKMAFYADTRGIYTKTTKLAENVLYTLDKPNSASYYRSGDIYNLRIRDGKNENEMETARYLKGDTVTVTKPREATDFKFFEWFGVDEGNILEGYTKNDTTMKFEMPAKDLSIYPINKSTIFEKQPVGDTVAVGKAIDVSWRTKAVALQTMGLLESKVDGKWTAVTVLDNSYLEREKDHSYRFISNVPSSQTYRFHFIGSMVGVEPDHYSDEFTLNWRDASVTGISVSPLTAQVQKGKNQQFTSDVIVEGPYEGGVWWSIEGAESSGTQIDQNGVLTVAPDETAKILYVQATSLEDRTKSAMSIVNVVNMPVTRYTLSVVNGTGDGNNFKEGDMVSVEADAASGGNVFDHWISTDMEIHEDSAYDTSFEFYMPAKNVVVIATYKNPTHPEQLTGTVTITGLANLGETVTATVNDCNETGDLFYQWMTYGTISAGIGQTTYVFDDASDVDYPIFCQVTSDRKSGSIIGIGGVITKYAGDPVEGVEADDYNNILTGITIDMEYSIDAGASWEPYIVEEPPVFPGNVSVEVRRKDTYDSEAGPATTFAFTDSGLQSIEITKPATKTVYKIGELLDIEGLEVTGTYDDGTKLETITKSMISGFDSKTVGSKTLTVNVGGKKATYDISIEKSKPSAPAAPVVVSRTKDSVTFAKNSKNEFKYGGGDWQDSETFTGLVTGTTYKFVTRIKSTDIADESDASPETVITLSLPSIIGPVSITGTTTYGETLKADISNLDNVGANPTYQWIREWIQGGSEKSIDISEATEETYTLVKDDIGKIISVKVIADPLVGFGFVLSGPTMAIEKKAGPAAPTGISSTDETKAGLNDGTLVGTAPGQEYNINDASEWTPIIGDPVTGLAPGSYIVVRVAETETHKAGAATSPYFIAGVVDPPLVTHTVTVIDGGTGASSAGYYTLGDSVTIIAGTRSGYKFEGWTLNGISVSNPNSSSITFDMPDNAVTATAKWASIGGGSGGGGGSSTPISYIITTSAGQGGSIDTAKTVSVKAGGSANFNIKPNEGYEIEDVKVDGKSVGVVNNYEFKNVNAEHTISATFKKMDDTSGMPYNFTDVPEDTWYYESVMNARDKGWFFGTSDTTFSPNAEMTRGMIVTVLWRIEGQPSAKSHSFNDVAADQYYNAGVAWAAEHGIVSGYGNDLFGPEDSITREQMAVILMNYAKYKGYDISMKADLSKFADGESISPWAKDAISWANAEGLIQGSGSQLMPVDNALRCQVAAILQRFIETIAK